MDPKDPIELNENVENNSKDNPDPKDASSVSSKLNGSFKKPFFIKFLLSLLALLAVIWLIFPTGSQQQESLKTRFVIGVDPTWYPLQLWSKEKNMTAFCETLVGQIAKKLGVEVQFFSVKSDRLFLEFASGSFDGVLSAMLPPMSNPPYLTSHPIYRIGPTLILNSDAPYKSLDEMAGKIVALVGEARVSINIDEYPDIIFSGYSTISRAFADLNNRRIDGVIVDALQARIYSKGLYANTFIASDFPLTNEGILLVLSKTPQAERFMGLFNLELQEMRNNGSYSKLLKAWDVIEE